LPCEAGLEICSFLRMQVNGSTESAACMSSSTGAWYALRTKPKQERRAFLNLRAWGIEAFVPWMCLRPNPSVLAPLFPGYIFARCNASQGLYKISFTRGVSHIVSFGGIPAIVENDVMAVIRSRTDENGIAQIEPHVEPGDVVMVHTGPLRNLVGVFERELPDNERIEILLTTIAYNARVKVSRHDVRKLDDENIS
jgi:transcriptional antiterminator RfaH